MVFCFHYNKKAMDEFYKAFEKETASDFIQTILKAERKRVGKVIDEQKEIEEIPERLFNEWHYDDKMIAEKSNEHTQAINKLNKNLCKK